MPARPDQQLDASNLPDLARGCRLLGAGGGGDTELGLQMALQAVEEHGPVELVALGDLPADARVMPCGLAGSPAVSEERIWSGDEGGELRAIVERCRTLVGTDPGQVAKWLHIVSAPYPYPWNNEARFVPVDS